jgi:hypothetical protein
MRMAQGTGDGPALMFSNIKDYNKKRSARPEGVRLFAVELPPRGDDARPAAGRIRASW